MLSELWVDITNDYDNAKDAELALLRNILDVELEPTFVDAPAGGGL